MNDSKVCRQCEVSKPLTAFAKSHTGRLGVRSVCKECTKSYARQWYVDNMKASDIKFKNIKSKYGITKDQYLDLLKEQDHKCRICGTGEVDSGYQTLCVDHCHVTGKVRGLLCDKCNTGLGHFRDNKLVLEAAIKYLKDYE